MGNSTIPTIEVVENADGSIRGYTGITLFETQNRHNPWIVISLVMEEHGTRPTS